MGTVYRKRPVKSVFTPPSLEPRLAAVMPLPSSSQQVIAYAHDEAFSFPEVQTSGLRKHLMNILPVVLVTLGSVLLANVIWPIVQYQVFVSPTLQQQRFVSPVAESVKQGVVAGMTTVESANAVAMIPTPTPSTRRKAPLIITDELDFTNLSAWFPSEQIPEIRPEQAKTYEIDIPALGVEKAEVKIGGLNLDKNLIQYPGTANPGELGSPVIFGHSVSPLFYNPSLKNPRRYVSIFTKLMSLKKDDTIIVRYDGVTYTYRVTNKTEVKPQDTYILEQRYDVRELKLITCTPAGTYLRRGIVFAQLEDVTEQ